LNDRRLKAELWDRVHFLMRNYWDGMCHCILYYDGVPDETVLSKATKFVIDSVPVLHSSYVNHIITPYWIVRDYEIGDAFSVIESEDIEKDAFEFVTNVIPVTSNVQYRFRLIKGKDRSALCVLCNHMCADGGDFLYLVSKYCDAYMKILNGEEPQPIKCGSRSYREMYSGLNEEDTRTAKGLFVNVSSSKERFKLPYTEKHEADKPIFVQLCISPEQTDRIKDKAKLEGFTMNDVLQAAFSRAIYKHAQIPIDKPLHISCMKDLRTAMKNNGLHTGITNHTGFIPCQLQNGADTIHGAIRDVHEVMEKQKADPFMGMYGIPLLNLSHTIFPEIISQLAITIGYKSPRYSVSNLGKLDPSAVRLGDCRLSDIYMMGTVKHKPAVQLATLTLYGTIHITTAVLGSDRDRELLNEFLRTIEQELVDYVSTEAPTQTEETDNT